MLIILLKTIILFSLVFPQGVDYAGPDDPAAIGEDRVWELFPVHHVLADRVAPALARSRIVSRFMLEKEVVLAVVIHHAVRVIEPVLP